MSAKTRYGFCIGVESAVLPKPGKDEKFLRYLLVD
jgi:hypothetical protein